MTGRGKGQMCALLDILTSTDQFSLKQNKRIMAHTPHFALISLVKVSLCIVRGTYIQLSIIWAYMIEARSKRYLKTCMLNDRTSMCQLNRLGSKIKEILECLKTCMLNIELPGVNKTDVMASIKIYRFDLFEGCLK